VRWYRRFLERHSEIKISRAQIVNYKRVDAATAENIKIFFDRLDHPEIRAIKYANTWNADEIGLMMGIGDNGMVVGDSYRKFLQSKDGGSREWVSIIEFISPGGQTLPPLMIFAGKHVQQQWFPDAEEKRYADWYFEASPKGWTNDDIAVRWLKGVFIPFTKPENPEDWQLLILDGHVRRSAAF
jgi:hypothetical protein